MLVFIFIFSLHRLQRAITSCKYYLKSVYSCWVCSGRWWENRQTRIEESKNDGPLIKISKTHSMLMCLEIKKKTIHHTTSSLKTFNVHSANSIIIANYFQLIFWWGLLFISMNCRHRIEWVIDSWETIQDF